MNYFKPINLFGFLSVLSVMSFSSVAFAKDTSKRDAYITQCLPESYHWIMKKIVKHESGFNPIAINVNGYRLNKKPSSKEEAIAWAEQLIKQGHSVDMGLAQINSQHFKPGRYFANFPIAYAFDECTNLRMGAYIYAKNHRSTNGNIPMALSLYNTGNTKHGFNNGYVNKVLAN